MGVEGTANLFLINPNGIVFGENTVVDVGGSFIATTAEKVEFEDGKTLVIRDRNSKPLLTWTSPTGLVLEKTSGNITVNGTGHNLIYTPEKILVPENNLDSTTAKINVGNGFAAIANQVVFDSGTISISAEAIEIASIERGKIEFSLRPQLNFDYSQVEKWGQVSLDNFSLIKINSNRAITTNFRGNSVELKNGSLIFSEKTSDISPALPQTLNITTQNELLLTGASSSIPSSEDGTVRGWTAIFSTNSAGKPVNINVISPELKLESGGSISTIGLVDAVGGNINIDSVEKINLSGFVSNSPLVGFSQISTYSLEEGKSGSIDINTKNLSINNGSSINSFAVGFGDSGSINIYAKESINLDGFTGIPSSVAVGSIFGNGFVGDINIVTKDLSIFNGGAITNSSTSGATGGDIEINAQNSITIDGFSDGGVVDGFDLAFSAIASFVFLPNANASEREIVDTFDLPTGNGGNISLTTNNLTLDNLATLTVQNLGTGDAGNININANFLELEQGGRIDAAALQGEGGNIVINNDFLTFNGGIISASSNGEGGNITLKSDRIELFDSDITASAGGEGNGGNVNINTDTILGINSDVTATAVFGNGGNIQINADGVLGLEEGKAIANNQTSEVDASSQFGQDGTVTINNPQTNTSNPLVAFQTPLPQRSELKIAEQCRRDERGRRGILRNSLHPNRPETPEDYLDDGESDAAEQLLWQPGKPMKQVDTLLHTLDGRIFAVNREDLAQMASKGCISFQYQLGK